MEGTDSINKAIVIEKQFEDFQQRFPWIGGDLQTLRDTFRTDVLPKDDGEILKIPVPLLPNTYRIDESSKLIAYLNKPKDKENTRGLVLLLHGLGGSSRRSGLRRMSENLVEAGFAVLRLNLRGADPGRELAAGTYAANCNSDLCQVFKYARSICKSIGDNEKSNNRYIPLFGVGLSLGGTILLNASLHLGTDLSFQEPVLDGLVCVSSPLDLNACSKSIELPRNRIYQSWLLHRLIKQTLADPFGISDIERENLLLRNNFGFTRISSIKDFDRIITAPRWGYKNVDEYYKNASPLGDLLQNPLSIPRTLLVQSKDDPWVPSKAVECLRKELLLKGKYNSSKIEFLITTNGGHNGFHGINGCWGDEVVKEWLLNTLIRILG